MANNNIFITGIEADFLAKAFQDAPPGTIGWSIYDKCRKTWGLDPFQRLVYLGDVYISVDEADYVADMYADAPLGGIENNIYEKCRRRPRGQHAFLSMQWK